MNGLFLFGLGALVAAVIIGIVYLVDGALRYSRSAVVTEIDRARQRRLERLSRLGSVGD
jgi:hypothetical protein